MQKLLFEVYIGEKMLAAQAENVKAVIFPNFIVPHGNYSIDGAEIPKTVDGFIRLYDAGTYFADWIDIVGNEQKICAKIHLNKTSLKRQFVGQEIVSFINKLDNLPDYTKIKNFSEII